MFLYRNVLLTMAGMLCWLTCLIVTTAMMPSYLTDELHLGLGPMGFVLSCHSQAPHQLRPPWELDMVEQSLKISLSDHVYSGFIVMRSKERRQRGVLLLNVFETEARIKFLPGYVSASFFTGPEGIVAEYVQWTSLDALAAAFKRPEFSEHLPINSDMTTRQALMFGAPMEIVHSNGSAELDFSAPSYAIVMFQGDTASMESLSHGVGAWIHSDLGQDITGAAILVDRKTNQVGVLFLGSFQATPVPPNQLRSQVIEQAGPLQLHSTIRTPSGPGEAPIAYALARTPAPTGT